LLATAPRRENRGAERHAVAPAALVPQERSRECGVNKTISAGGGGGGGGGEATPCGSPTFPFPERPDARPLYLRSPRGLLLLLLQRRVELRVSGAEAFRLRLRPSRGKSYDIGDRAASALHLIDLQTTSSGEVGGGGRGTRAATRISIKSRQRGVTPRVAYAARSRIKIYDALKCNKCEDKLVDH